MVGEADTVGLLVGSGEIVGEADTVGLLVGSGEVVGMGEMVGFGGSVRSPTPTEGPETGPESPPGGRREVGDGIGVVVGAMDTEGEDDGASDMVGAGDTDGNEEGASDVVGAEDIVGAEEGASVAGQLNMGSFPKGIGIFPSFVKLTSVTFWNKFLSGVSHTYSIMYTRIWGVPTCEVPLNTVNWGSASS